MANRKIAGITVEIGGDTTKLGKALSDVDKKSKNLKTELQEINKALKLDPKNTELLAQKQQVLAEAIKTSKEKLEKLKEAQQQITQQFQRGEIDEGQYRAFRREIEQTEQEIRNAEGELQSLGSQGKNTGQELGEAFEGAGDKISAAGDKIAGVGEKLLPVTAAITAIGGYGVKSAVEFEDAMAKLSTIADTTAVPIEQLEDDIKALSDSTGISASEIAENVYNAISAGQNTADAVNFVAQSSKLATAGFADSGAALDLLTTILNAYGMEASEVNHVSDVLINTQNLGKTTVAELASAMGKVIPTANASGVSLENLAASYSIMTAKGIATAESTTYLNSLLNELSKSGTKSSDTIRNKTGKTFQQLTNEGKSLADILEIVQESADENGLSMSDLFGSAEAGKAAMTLLSGGVDEYNSTLSSMQGASGKTDEAFEKLQTNSRKAQIALNQLKNSAIELGTTILRMLQPYIERVTERIKDLTSKFNALDDSTKETIVKVAGVVAAIGPLLIVIGKLTSGIGGVIASTGKLIAMIATNPAALAVAGIAAVVAALAVLYLKNEEFRDFVNEEAKEIKEFFEEIAQECKDWYDENKPLIDDMIKVLKFLGEVLVQYLMESIRNTVAGFKLAWTRIKATWQVSTAWFRYIWDTIKGIFSVVKDVLSGDFGDAWEEIKKIFSPSRAKEFFGQVFDAIKDSFIGLGSFFKSKFGNAWSMITGVFNKASEYFGGVFTDIKNAFKELPDALADIFRKALKKVKEIAGEIGDTVSSVVDKIPGASLVKKGISGFKGLFANGGTLNRNGETAIVGDAGPELLQLLNGKAVVTPLTNTPKSEVAAESTQIAPQRTVVHQTYNIYVKEFANSQDARTTSQELAKLQRQTDFGKGLA